MSLPNELSTHETRITYDAVLAEGVKRGFAQGVEQGRAEGVERGRAEGVERGRAEGVERGRAALLALVPPGVDGATRERLRSLDDLGTLAAELVEILRGG